MTKIIGSGKAIEEDRVKQLEEDFGYELPTEYRRFLLEYNGGYPEPDVFTFVGSEDGSSVDRFLGLDVGEYSNLDKYLRTYKGRIPAGFLPIAHDPGGNLVCIGLCGDDRGRIYFWDHEMEADDTEPDMFNMSLVSEVFSDFLRSLYKIEV